MTQDGGSPSGSSRPRPFRWMTQIRGSPISRSYVCGEDDAQPSVGGAHMCHTLTPVGRQRVASGGYLHTTLRSDPGARANIYRIIRFTTLRVNEERERASV